MLALDDPRWRETRHSYGTGENIPPYIERLDQADPLGDQFWDEFGNQLFHQCDRCSASVAAFPHLIRIAAKRLGTDTGYRCLYNASIILGLILGETNEYAWKIQPENYPEYLRQPFLDAVKIGQTLISKQLFAENRTYNETLAWVGMSGVFGGHSQIFFMLPKLSNCKIYCPNCDDEFEYRDWFY